MIHAKRASNKKKQSNMLYQTALFWPSINNIDRDGNICKYIYIYIFLARKYQFLEDVPKWYNHDLEQLLENDSTKVLWNLPVQTERCIDHKPDIVIQENYVNLLTELKQLWNVCFVKTIPVVIGTCGTIHKKFEKSICGILDINISANKIQHIVLLGTANISRYFLYTDLKEKQTTPSPTKRNVKKYFFVIL